MFSFDFPTQILSFLTSYWMIVQISLLLLLGVIYFLAFKKPIWANFIIIILLPTYLFRRTLFSIPYTFLEISILIVFAALIIRMAINKDKITKNYKYPFRWQILLILLAATIAVIISPQADKAAGLWKAYFIEPLMFLIVLINTVKTKKDKEIILWALGLSTLSVSLLAIYQKFTAFGIAEASWIVKDARRVNAMFTSPNAVGLFLSPIMIIYLGWLLDDIKNKFILTWKFVSKILIILLCLLAIIFTVSQGTWLGIAVALVFISFFAWSKKWTTAIIAIFIIFILLIPQTKNLVLSSLAFESPSAQNRLTLYNGSIDFLTKDTKNIVFGAGLYGFGNIQEKFRDPLKMEPLIYPHNIILNFWMEIGLLGLFAFVWLIFAFFKRGFKKIKEGDFGQSRLLMIGILAAMITILVHGFIDVPYFKNDLAVLFWIIISLTVI